MKELVVNSVATSDLAHPKGLKQLVRLELVCTTGSSSVDNWIEIRLFPPIFFNSAN